jgi:hypothetical protein
MEVVADRSRIRGFERHVRVFQADRIREGSTRTRRVGGDVRGDQLVPDLPDLLDGELGRIRVEDAGLRLEDLPEWPVGDALPVGEAAPVDQERRPRQSHRPARELLDQPRLADAGVSVDGDQLRPPIRGAPVEHAPHHRELGHPSDHRRAVEASVGPLRRARFGHVLVEQLVGADRLLLPLQGQPTQLPERNVARSPDRSLAHQDLTGLGALLQSRGDVHGIPGDEPFSRTGDRASDDDACVDADAHRQSDRVHVLERTVKPIEATSHPQGSSERPRWVVLVRGRHAEDRDDRVADELLDDPAFGLDLPAHRREERIEDVAQPLRVELLAERRRAGDVGEQDRHPLPLLAG